MPMSFLKRLPLIQQLLLVLVPVSLIVSVLVAGEFHRCAAQSIEDSTSAMMAASNDAAACAIADLQAKALVIASIFAVLAAGCLLIMFFVNVRMIQPINRASRIALEFANSNLDGLQIGSLTHLPPAI
jgi:hypothetical protein